ncbi:MAG: cation:proton antiporter domain-containing protein [Thermodesulfobacteriota bacterium]
MQLILLNDILTIFGISVTVLYVCHRLRVPPIVGFLITGILAGPYGLGLVKAISIIEILAEVGVVLLLFTIGLEFSLANLWRLGRPLLLASCLQIFLTFLAILIITKILGLPIEKAIFAGFLISLSSTAIVVKILQDRGEVESIQGHAILGILIFQDLITVPMMLLMPVLAGAGNEMARALLIFLLEGLGMALLVFVGAKWLVPWIFFRIAETKIRELFALSVIVICLAVAWITHLVGLSLALGAFLAGLIISESEYGHQALGNIIPFRDVFTSFFFVSIGMLLDLNFIWQNPWVLGFIAAGILILKSLLAGLAVVLMGLPLRIAIIIGMSLSQIGEFSFILGKAGNSYGLIDDIGYQMFLAISILTMILTPFLIGLAPKTADLILKLPFSRKLKRGSYVVKGTPKIHEKDHLIIVGFGINGRNIGRAARAAGIPYVIVEINPQVVREEAKKKEPIFFGDATHEAVLQHARLKEARIIVVVINDPVAARRITEISRRLNPKIHIIVRTRYLREVEPLYQLGANEVIPEEYETSIEIFARVLAKYLLPKDEIERFVGEVRAEGYGMLRSLAKEAATCRDLAHCLPDLEIGSLRVSRNSPFLGKTLAQTEMRKKYKVTLLAIRRDHKLIYNPDPHTEFQENDILLLIGAPEKIGEIASFFPV